MSGLRLLPGAEHFRVDELPLYEPAGSGEHRYYQVEKRGVTSDAAARILARAHNLPPRAVGSAGRKDRHAITTQWFSAHDPGMRQSLDAERLGEHLRILAEERHDNKLRTGHLRGNRFRLALAAEPDLIEHFAQQLPERAAAGLPNGFGPQRYGRGGSTLRAAQALAAGDHAAAITAIIAPDGQWHWGEPVRRGSRQALDDDLRRAIRSGIDDPAEAWSRGGRKLQQLVVSCAQSAIFDAVLAARQTEGSCDRAAPGEVLQFGRICKRVDDATEAQSALATGEAVLTGPLPGSRMPVPEDAHLKREQHWSATAGFDWSCFEKHAPLSAPGSRRPLLLRFLEEPRLEREGDLAWLCFALPAGGYATTVLEHWHIALPADRS